MKVGYVLITQNTTGESLQLEALRRYGCNPIFQERESGSPAKHRPQFEQMMQLLGEGGELVVWDINCLNHTTLELICMIGKLNQARVRFKSLSQPLLDTGSPSTTTPQGELISQLFALLTDYERNRRVARSRTGLSVARARGRRGGRPRGLSPHYQQVAPMVVSAYGQGQSIREIMKAFQIPSSATVYKILTRFEVPITPYRTSKTAKSMKQLSSR